MVVDKKKLKDAILIVTCCISFVAAFAVALKTMARSGAKHVVVSLAILVPIVLGPPVLVSVCLSLLKTDASRGPLVDEENSLESIMQQQPSWWHQFHQPAADGDDENFQQEQEQHRFGQQAAVRDDDVSVTRLRLVLGQEQEQREQQVQVLTEAILRMSTWRRMCPNVLPLLGFDVHGSTLLLASPRLANLATTLPLLAWPTRVRVAALVARGLCRLHHFASEQPIVHGDLTPHRIHMQQGESEWTPYIADAGILKLTSMPIFAASSWTTCPDQEQSSTKSDVYAFGVILLVLLSGNSSVVARRSSNLSRIMDDKLGGQYVKEQARTIQRAACCCTRNKPDKRPDMIQVDAMLRPLLLSSV